MYFSTPAVVMEQNFMEVLLLFQLGGDNIVHVASQNFLSHDTC